MGHAEEAQVNLARAKKGDETAARLAQVHATLAVLESVEGLSSQVDYLSDTIEGKRHDRG